MSKGNVEAYLVSSKARRKRRNAIVAVFAGLVGVVSLVGVGVFLMANRWSDTSQGIPVPKVLESVLKPALGKPAHGMTLQEFKSKLHSLEPPLVKGVGETLDNFSVSNQGTPITFYVLELGGDEVDKHVEMVAWQAFYGTPQERIFHLPCGAIYGHKAEFLSTFGEPDLMTAAGPYLRFEYQLRGGKVTLSVFAPYWEMGVFWVRSLKYEGAYSD